MVQALPKAIDMEQSVLCDCFVLQDDEAIIQVTGEMSEDDFYDTRHKRIFKAMCELQKNGEPIDAATVAETMGSDLASVLAAILDAPVPANRSHYIRIIKEKAAMRRLIGECNAITKRAMDQFCDPAEVIDYAHKAVTCIDVGPEDCPSISIGACLPDVYDEIEKRVENRGRLLGISTGFKRVDNMILGLIDTNFIILAGRPSMGKSAMMMSMALAAAKESTPVIFSLEMSKNELTLRAISMLSSVGLQDIRSGNLTAQQLEKVTDASALLHETRLEIDDKGGLTIGELRRRARAIHKKKGKGPIFVDYLQLMPIETRRGDRKDLEIGEISAGLKSIAKSLNVPVVALSQLNRGLEQRQDKRPKMSDLRESGALEQDADIIIFPFRPEVYVEPKIDDNGKPTKKFLDVKGRAEVIIAKHRNGPTGTVQMAWVEHMACFMEASQ